MARPRAKPDSRRNRRQPPVSKSLQKQGGAIRKQPLGPVRKSGRLQEIVRLRCRLESQEHPPPLPSISTTHNRIGKARCEFFHMLSSKADSSHRFHTIHWPWPSLQSLIESGNTLIKRSIHSLKTGTNLAQSALGPHPPPVTASPTRCGIGFKKETGQRNTSNKTVTCLNCLVGRDLHLRPSRNRIVPIQLSEKEKILQQEIDCTREPWRPLRYLCIMAARRLRLMPALHFARPCSI